MTVFDILKKRPLTGYPSTKNFHRAVRRLLGRLGHTPVQASYDRAGNCKICGECGRCPGWHLQEEKDNPVTT